MSDSVRRSVLGLLFAAGAAIVAAPVGAYTVGDGSDGRKLKSKSQEKCAQCHRGSAVANAVVEGPKSAIPGSTNRYRLHIEHARAFSAGFQIRASGGQLKPVTAAQYLDDAIAHAKPLRTIAGETIVEFEWRAPDAAGSYQIKAAALAANNDGSADGDAVAQAKLEVEVGHSRPKVSSPPAASAGGPYAGLIGTELMFDGSASRDLDGQIVKYEWNFGDGTTMAGSGRIFHAFQSPGTYTVTLTVTDNDDLSAQAVTLATVLAAGAGQKPPVANAGGPYKAHVGLPVQLDASASSDPDGRIIAYQWELGDGSRASGAYPRHVYAQPGQFLARITVTDDQQLPASATTVVQVFESEYVNISRFITPPSVTLRPGWNPDYMLAMTAELIGVIGSQPICGTAYLQRNGQPYRHESLCFPTDGPKHFYFREPFNSDDAPAVSWTTYIVLDNGMVSDRVNATTRVIP